jgi:DNA-binding response OmpR family regulator
VRVVIVEDEARIREFISNGLAAEGIATHGARSGAEAARVVDAETDLTDREFRLLHYFALHPGELLSRERLLSAVWGYHSSPGSNVVDVCIRRFRRKLGPLTPIETLRHAGYRLAAD